MLFINIWCIFWGLVGLWLSLVVLYAIALNILCSKSPKFAVWYYNHKEKQDKLNKQNYEKVKKIIQKFNKKSKNKE